MFASPTPYADVNTILHRLLDDAKSVLGDQFIGMYLFGSLATGGFDEASDIDVLIVTRDEITEAQFSTLAEMHKRIASINSPWAVQLEVSYIPLAALRRFDPANKRHPRLDRGKDEVLRMMDHETDWIIQRHVLRESGITVEGPAPQTLIDSVSQADLRQAVVDVLPLWINPILEDPFQQLKNRGYQSFIVLSLCRMLYTVRYGAVLSKDAAADWVKEELDEEWRPLIERAIIGRQNSSLDTVPEDMDATLKFMEYAQTAMYAFNRTLPLPTPYPQVNEVLHLLLSRAKEILVSQFVGMYLYGSLATGDFNPETSDVDFLVVTSEPLDNKTISKLEAMHSQVWATSLKRAGKLEGAYVSRDLIRKHDPHGLPCPAINEGKFYVAPLGSDWIIQRHVVREYGVVLEGPDPQILIDFVTPQDIRRSIMGVLQEWWFPMLENPSWLREHDNVYRSFAIITMCRVLHGLEHGMIVSKPKAAAWARTQLDGCWNRLIDKAIAVSIHEALDIPLEETLEFIRYTKQRVERETS